MSWRKFPCKFPLIFSLLHDWTKYERSNLWGVSAKWLPTSLKSSFLQHIPFMCFTIHTFSFFKKVETKARWKKIREKSKNLGMHATADRKMSQRCWREENFFIAFASLLFMHTNSFARLNSIDNPKINSAIFQRRQQRETLMLMLFCLIKIKNLCRFVPLWEWSRKNFRTTIFPVCKRKNFLASLITN